MTNGPGKSDRPEAVSYTHLDVYKRQGDARHEWSPLKLLILVGLKRQFDVVVLALQRIVLDDYLEFLAGLCIFPRHQDRSGLKGFDLFPRSVELAGQHRILLQRDQ